jgi:hypothetical protein
MLRRAQESINSEPTEADRAGSPPARHELRKWLKGLWIFLMVLAAVEFVTRGPWRALSESGDFAMPYLSAGVWLRGGNPYDHGLVDRLWAEAGGAPERKPLKFNTPTVYPPTALPVIAPLTLLNWREASVALLAINSLLALLSLAALISTAGLDWREPRGSLFLVLGMAFAPLHTGIALGNLIIPAAALAMLAMWASARKRDLLAGVLLALATGIKPQIGGVVLIGFAFKQRWRIVVVAGVLLLALTSLSVLRLEIAGADWRQSWLSNNAESIAPGGPNDPTAANRSRHHMINLHWPLYAIFDRAWLVNSIVLIFAGSLLSILLLSRLRGTASRQELLSISAFMVLGLAVIYHRFYDAVLLLTPLAWSLAAWNGLLKAHARLIFTLILPFLIPGAVMLQESARAGAWPATLNDAWWWNTLALPHQVWAVALLAICLVYAQSRMKRCPEY